MTGCIEFLGRLAGTWEGDGVNHEGQNYHGRLTLHVPVNPFAAINRFSATGTDGTVYHEETLMVGMDESGGFIAYSASNNIPGIVRFSVTQPSPASLVFTLGDLADAAAFREVITIRKEPEGTLFHGFAWAMPGEAMQDRSSARLALVG